jgi:TonB family protein
MQKCRLAALYALLTLASTGAQAKPFIDTIPFHDWARRPSFQDLLDVYPAAARKLHVEGHVTLDCRVDPAGKLTDCQVYSEDPQSFGFGLAAMSLVPRFVAEHTPPDASVATRVKIPISFRLPQQ